MDVRLVRSAATAITKYSASTASTRGFNVTVIIVQRFKLLSLGQRIALAVDHGVAACITSKAEIKLVADVHLSSHCKYVYAHGLTRVHVCVRAH